jgi:hypothetical protein
VLDPDPQSPNPQSPNPPLEHPVVAYKADTNIDAQMAERFLVANGVPAYAVEDHSLAGYWLGGTIPHIHKPQVWVDKPDLPRAVELIEEFKQLNAAKNAERKRNEPQTLEATCEDCEKTSHFAGSLNGTVQTCPHCGSFIDVGEFEWPEDETTDDQAHNRDPDAT